MIMNNLMLDYSQLLNKSMSLADNTDTTETLNFKDLLSSIHITDRIKRQNRKSTKIPFNKIKKTRRLKNKIAKLSRKKNRKK